MTGFTRVFGGGTIQASLSSYSALSITANTQLQWPKEAQVDGIVVSRIMDVEADPAGLNLIMPPANQVGLGYSSFISNVGSEIFILVDFDNNTIVSIDPGQSFLVYVTNNEDEAGEYRTIEAGATPSSAVASALAGAGLKATGATLAMAWLTLDRSVTGYTIGEADRASIQRWTGGVGTFNLPDPNALTSDFVTMYRNDGSGILTLTPASGTIDGLASKSVAPGESGFLINTGSLYYTISGGGGSSTGFDYTSIAVGGSGDYTLSGAELNRIAYRFTGVLTGNRNIIVPSTVQQYWVRNDTTGAFTLTVKTAAGSGIAVAQGQAAILYSDGTNVVDADTGGISTPISIANGGTGAVTASGARSNLGSSATGDAVFVSATAAAARAALGATSVGDAVFIAANAAAARSAIAALGNTGLQTISDTGVGDPLFEIISTDAGSTVGPGLSIYRNSASPLANDVIGVLRFYGKDTAGNKEIYANMFTTILDPTSGNEDSQINISLQIGGVLSNVIRAGPGVALGSPLGIIPSTAGHLNMVGIQQNGVSFVPRNHIGGLVSSNNGADAANDIDVSAGQAEDDSHTQLMVLSASITKRLDASWVVGTNQGGLDTGASATNTWYYIWLIRRPDTGVVDVLFSLSPTAPTMPANYTQKRLLWAIYNQSTDSIMPFKQTGNRCTYGDVNHIVTTVVGTSAVLSSIHVPLIDGLVALIRVVVTNGGGVTRDVLITSVYEVDEAPSAVVDSLFTIKTNANLIQNSAELQKVMSASGQVRQRSSGASTDVAIATYGFIFDRGVDA